MRRWSLGGAYRRPAKGFLKNEAAALMREANEIGSGNQRGLREAGA